MSQTSMLMLFVVTEDSAYSRNDYIICFFNCLFFFFLIIIMQIIMTIEQTLMIDP